MGSITQGISANSNFFLKLHFPLSLDISRQAARFGVYSLSSKHGRHPVYHRRISKQFLFYQVRIMKNYLFPIELE